MKRLFFALWPDDGTRARLADLAELLLVNTRRRVPPENFHITLVFLGNVQEQDIPGLVDAAGRLRISSFQLQLSRCGWWKRARVTWLVPETTPASLLELVEQINRLSMSAGLPVEKRDYHPHLTIARKVTRPATARSFEPIHWNVRDFCLVESVTREQGPSYRVIKSWPLC